MFKRLYENETSLPYNGQHEGTNCNTNTQRKETRSLFQREHNAKDFAGSHGLNSMAYTIPATNVL